MRDQRVFFFIFFSCRYSGSIVLRDVGSLSERNNRISPLSECLPGQSENSAKKHLPQENGSVLYQFNERIIVV